MGGRSPDAGLGSPAAAGAPSTAAASPSRPALTAEGVADGLPGVLPDDAAAAPRWQVVDASALNVRAGPGTAEPVLDSLPRGAVAEGTGRTELVDGDLWVELRLCDGATGWASARFLMELDG